MKKYAIKQTDYTPAFDDEDRQVGWNEKGTPTLHLFDDEEVADDYIVSCAEAQDYDYQVEFMRVGWVELKELTMEGSDNLDDIEQEQAASDYWYGVKDNLDGLEPVRD